MIDIANLKIICYFIINFHIYRQYRQMKFLNDKLLKDLQLTLDLNEFKKLKQKFQVNTVINNNKDNKLSHEIESPTLTNSIRRPKNKRALIQNQNSDMHNTKLTFQNNENINKQKGVFYKAAAQLPNLHSQDVMNCYYGKQYQGLQKKQTLNQFQTKNTINKVFSLQELNNLKQLQLYFCQIDSLRSLGTGWKIKSLTIIGCRLTDFAGISGFSTLEDIFISYNKIKDLSQLLYHQTVCNIDLQGNQIDDITQIDYLQTIQNLKYLNLTENPIYKIQKKSLISRFSYLNFEQMQSHSINQQQQNWQDYEGYQEIQLLNQINHSLHSQKSIYQEVIYGLKCHQDNQSQIQYTSQVENLQQITHFYNKNSKELQEYLQQKITAIPFRILDCSKSRSKPKILQIHSKQKLKFKSADKQQQSTVITSTLLTNTGKSFRQTIRAEAKKKFLIRKSSMKKQSETIELNQPNSAMLKPRGMMNSTIQTGFRFPKTIFDYKV